MQLELFTLLLVAISGSFASPLSQIPIERAVFRSDESASVRASPILLEDHVGDVTVRFHRPSGASASDWIGVFSPAEFNSSVCLGDLKEPNREYPPYLCTAPIKFQFANYTSKDYVTTGIGALTFRLINQRSNFAFGFFSGFEDPVLIGVSNTVTFTDLKAPLYPRLAQGELWNEITVTWTSGYSTDEASPFVSWGVSGHRVPTLVPASTISLSREDMCGPPASTVGWRDPGHIHTGSMKNLWPRTRYSYQVGHRILQDNSVVLGPVEYFTSPPFPGDDSLQRVVIYGDLGKLERDGSNMYNDFEQGSLNTTDTIVSESDDVDIIFHIGDLSYANGYVSEWDQFTEQIQSLTSRIPYMTASGNHERDWPNSGSFYNSTDSGGECGVLASSFFNMPVKNRDKFWYATDYGLFHFCIADSEHDWREGTEQYKFIEECLASADRQKQPWLIFIAHRVLGYSSWYKSYENTTGEPTGRESLQNLWQKYKVDIAFFGHVHNYERSCPVYDEVCVSDEEEVYSGRFNATIHVVAGGGGASLTEFPHHDLSWSLRRDYDFGYTKLTTFGRSKLLFEYKKSRDGRVYDKFWIHRDYKDVLGCDALNNCPIVTLAKN